MDFKVRDWLNYEKYYSKKLTFLREGREDFRAVISGNLDFDEVYAIELFEEFQTKYPKDMENIAEQIQEQFIEDLQMLLSLKQFEHIAKEVLEELIAVYQVQERFTRKLRRKVNALYKFYEPEPSEEDEEEDEFPELYGKEDVEEVLQKEEVPANVKAVTQGKNALIIGPQKIIEKQAKLEKMFGFISLRFIHTEHNKNRKQKNILKTISKMEEPFLVIFFKGHCRTCKSSDIRETTEKDGGSFFEIPRGQNEKKIILAIEKRL